MSEDQLYDAAEREMDIYRAEITRITAARDEYLDDAILHVRERDQARAELDEFRVYTAKLNDGIRQLLADITASADATRPSKKTALEDEFAIALRKLLEPS